MTAPHVYTAITAITNQMGMYGISKDKKNQQQGYSFRGIDDVLNALSPMLAKNNLCILPYVLERECEQRQSKSGGVLFYVTVRVRFDFVSAVDGSKHEVVMCGEAMDSADKATNKAMSAAYKYAAIQAFCIPTEGDNDPDSTTHEVAAPIEYVSVDQISAINDAAIAANVSLSKICEVMKVPSISAIPAALYSKIINKINTPKKAGA